MKEVTCFKTSDGKLFENNKKASDHQQDLIGEMLDGLLPDDDRGNLTRADRYNILMKMIKDPALKHKIENLHFALFFNNDEE